MSASLLSTAQPGLIGRLFRIDDWRWIELQADSLVIDRRDGRETVTLDRIVDWAISTRGLWSELQLRLDDGRQLRLRGGPTRWKFGKSLDGALLEVRIHRLARAVVERRNEELALARSVGETLGGECYLSHRETQQLIAATGFLAALDDLDIERVVTSLDAPLQRAVRHIADFRSIDETKRAAVNERFRANAASRYRDFFDRVESRPLTERQRQAALTGEDATLVLAGAGSGKTSVLMARTGFILESRLASESDILLLAFARKAQQEMAERIEARLGRRITVSTFHGLGLAIIGEAEGRRPSLSKLAEDTRLFRQTIARFVDQAAAEPTYRSRLVRFLATLLVEAKLPEAFESRDAYLQYVRGVEPRSLKNERVKGFGELGIANFLALNGVPYAYEKPYPVNTADARRRRYHPDFTLTRDEIYLEHLGLDRQGNTAPWIDRETYFAGIEWKRALHEQHGTRLVETFHWQHVEGKLDHVLRQTLAEHAVALEPVDDQRLLDELREAGRVGPFAELVSVFLKLHKASGLSFEQFEARAIQIGDGGRATAFLELYRPIRERYDRALAEAGEIDFDDMIHRATDHVRTGRWRSPYRFVLVDEFQDISQGRAELLQALQKQRSDTQLFAVGDDWQSIYRFAGADIGLINHFREHFGVTEKVELDLTFHMPDRLTDLAAAFVQRNPMQTRRQISVVSHAAEAVVHLHWHPAATDLDADTEGGRRHEWVDEDDGLAAVLAAIAAEATGRQQVLLLGRYSFQKPKELSRLRRAYPNLQLEFSTVHAAKGLEADVVVVLDLSVGRYGFPSGVTDYPLLSLVLADADPFAHAEERRLFYVALTRAKRCVHLIVPTSGPSPFAREIAEAGPAVRQHGEPKHETERCPECGGAMVLRKGKSAFLGAPTFRCVAAPVERRTGMTAPTNRRFAAQHVWAADDVRLRA